MLKGLFLKNPESEKVRNLEMSIEEIKEAKNELVRLSNDQEQRMLYEMREKILKDKISALNKAKNEGREEGLQEGLKEGLIKTAKNLLAMGMDVETVSKATGLSVEEIRSLEN